MGIVWGIADLVRSLYNFNHTNKFIIYLRYNLYKILYPLGSFIEVYGLINFINNLFINTLIISIYLYGLPVLMTHINKNEIALQISQKLNEYKENIESIDNIEKNNINNYKIIKFKNKEYILYNYNYELFYKKYNNDVNKRFIYKDNVLIDLGKQINWRTVYIIEYLGGLIFFPYIINNYSDYGVKLWILHYIKRIFESIYIHKFSKNTMPITNLFKNCIYYWMTSIYLSYTTITYNYNIFNINIFIKYIIIFLWFISQILNFNCHYIQSYSRKNNEYVLLNNGLFKYVCCPNYSTEIFCWFCFALLSDNYYTFLTRITFMSIGFIQMYIWAKKKHIRNKKLFGNDYKIQYLLFYNII